MNKVIFGLALLLVFSSNAYAQKKTTTPSKAKTPLHFNIEFGLGSVSAESKIDSAIKTTGSPTALFGVNLTSGHSTITVRTQQGLDNWFTGHAVEVNGRQHGFSVKKLSVGITGYYFFSKEIDTFGMDVGYLAQSSTRKHALDVGVDLLFQAKRGWSVRGSYSMGAMYIRKDGVFNFDNLDRPIVKLADWDSVPTEMLALEGRWPVWRLEFAGSGRTVRSINVFNKVNTKGLIPFRHTVADASVSVRVWKFLSISAGKTLADSSHGTSFLGSSSQINLIIKK